MKKLVSLIYKNGILVQVASVKEFENATDLMALQKQAESNEKTIDDKLLDVISALEERLLKVETELKYNRGEISQKEYEEICLGKK